MNTSTEKIWKDFNLQLRKFILSRVKDEDVTKDLLQEVYIKIHNKIHKLRESEKLQSWVYQITRNTVIDYFRVKSDFTYDMEKSQVAEETGKDLQEFELEISLRKMIAGLPLKYREALVLTEYKNLSHKQIADRLNITIPAVKSRVQRAKEKLKEMLLDCCHFELDSYNKIIDYHPKCSCCSGTKASNVSCSQK